MANFVEITIQILVVIPNRVFALADTIKFGGKTFSDVEFEAKDGIEAFQAIVYSLCFVPVERQKLLFKSKMVKVSLEMPAFLH